MTKPYLHSEESPDRAAGCARIDQPDHREQPRIPAATDQSVLGWGFDYPSFDRREMTMLSASTHDHLFPSSYSVSPIWLKRLMLVNVSDITTPDWAALLLGPILIVWLPSSLLPGYDDACEKETIVSESLPLSESAILNEACAALKKER